VSARIAELNDPAWLRREYVNRGRTSAEIATDLGCNYITVLNALKRHSIPRHPRSRPRFHVGAQVGRLTVIERLPADRYGHSYRCICDCGNEAVVRSAHLVKGTRSCGCLRRQRGRNMLTTHGQSDTPTYASYAAAKTRCINPNVINWQLYGGRGIEFRYESFEHFLADVGERVPGTSIDRIDVNGHYEPGNCRWATPAEQNANQRPRTA
jgi:hypothetical protein